MEAVTGRSFDSVEAMALGYARYLLKERMYPGMTPVSGHHTCGRVYVEVDEHSLGLLDQFEDDVYVRQLIPVQTTDRELVEGLCLYYRTEGQGLVDG